MIKTKLGLFEDVRAAVNAQSKQRVLIVDWLGFETCLREIFAYPKFDDQDKLSMIASAIECFTGRGYPTEFKKS